MSDIKFVYFDVGGVLLLDYSGTDKWQQMKLDLGIVGDLDNIFEELWNKNNPRICIDCDVDKLFAEFKENTEIDVPENYSMLDDFINRFELNESIWDLVKKTKQKYKVGLLTNMYPRMLEKIINKKLIPDIDWDVIVDSSIVKNKKPFDVFFDIAENKSGFSPEEIFFTDNQQRHVDAASKRGWKTMVYDPTDLEQSTFKLNQLLELDD